MPRTMSLALTALIAAVLTTPVTAQSRPAAGSHPPRAGAGRGGAGGAGRQGRPAAAGGAAARASQAGEVAKSLAWMAGTWGGRATVSHSPRPIPLEIVVTPEVGAKFFVAKTKAPGPAGAMLDDLAVIGMEEQGKTLVAWRFTPKGEVLHETVDVQPDEGKVVFEGEAEGGTVRRTFARAAAGVSLTIEKTESATGESEVLLDVVLRKLPPGLAAKLQRANQPRRAGAAGGGQRDG